MITQKKRLVSRIAYLIGINKDRFQCDEYDWDEYELCEKLDAAREFRAFYQMRNFFIRNASSSYSSSVSIEDHVYYPKEAALVLTSSRLQPRITGAGSEENIFYLNREIATRVNDVYDLLNTNVEKAWYKELFTLPKIPGEGQYNKNYKGKINEAVDFYKSLPSSYPHHMYIRHPLTQGDVYVFRDDAACLTWLFAINNKQLPADINVFDRSVEGKERIYDFVREHERCVLICDCENSDPYKLVSMFRGMKDEIADIEKIILCTDPNATAVWKYFEKEVGIPTEFIMVERINAYKSLVDITIAATACKEYYQNGIEAFLIASSDSDFWGLFKALPEANFLVLLEDKKAGQCLMDAMKENMMYYCCIDDFQSDGGSLQRTAIKCCFEEELNSSMTAKDMYEIAEDVMQACWIPEEEKDGMREWIEKNVINKVQLEWITKGDGGERVKIPRFAIR